MPILVKRLIAALVIVLLLIAMNQYMSEAGLFGFGVPPYYARVIMLAGINIILAVSLNLITGFTGQFSIGHAGFMAVGAYSSAYLTVYYAQAWERSLAVRRWPTCGGWEASGCAHSRSSFRIAWSSSPAPCERGTPSRLHWRWRTANFPIRSRRNSGGHSKSRI